MLTSGKLLSIPDLLSKLKQDIRIINLEIESSQNREQRVYNFLILNIYRSILLQFYSNCEFISCTGKYCEIKYRVKGKGTKLEELLRKVHFGSLREPEPEPIKHIDNIPVELPGTFNRNNQSEQDTIMTDPLQPSLAEGFRDIDYTVKKTVEITGLGVFHDPARNNDIARVADAIVQLTNKRTEIIDKFNHSADALEDNVPTALQVTHDRRLQIIDDAIQALRDITVD